MWDDEGNGTLFDQSGNFRDQEEYERFVEEYTPLSSLHPDEIDDVANTFNVDSERIDDFGILSIRDDLGDMYQRGKRLRFSTDFEARISAIWHFQRSPGMQTFKESIDPLVRAAARDYYRQSGLVNGNGHPETCTCPECNLFYAYLEYAVRDLGPDESTSNVTQPDSTTRQSSLEPLRSSSAPHISSTEPIIPTSNLAILPSNQSHTPSETKPMGWFARLVRPWSWFRR